MREDGGGRGREKERMKEGEEEEEGEVEVEEKVEGEGEGEKEDDGADCGEAVLPVLNPESSGQALSLSPRPLSLSPSPSPSLSPHPGSLSHAREPRVALPRDGAVIHSLTEAAPTSVTPSFRHLGRAGQSRLSRAGQSPRGRGWDACDVIARWPRRSTPNTSGTCTLHTIVTPVVRRLSIHSSVGVPPKAHVASSLRFVVIVNQEANGARVWYRTRLRTYRQGYKSSYIACFIIHATHHRIGKHRVSVGFSFSLPVPPPRERELDDSNNNNNNNTITATTTTTTTTPPPSSQNQRAHRPHTITAADTAHTADTHLTATLLDRHNSTNITSITHINRVEHRTRPIDNHQKSSVDIDFIILTVTGRRIIGTSNYVCS